MFNLNSSAESAVVIELESDARAVQHCLTGTVDVTSKMKSQ